MMDHPPVSVEHPLPARPDVSADVPQVTDGVVYLPAGQSVEPDSPEFEALLRKNLPSEILPDVLTNWRGVSARTSRLRLFAATLFLLASAAFLYWFFPPAVHPDLVPYGGLEIRYTGPALPFSSPYGSLNRKASAAFERGDYNTVCQILKSEVEKIINTGDSQSYILAFRYFQAVRQLHGKYGHRRAAMLLGKLKQEDPDTPAWAQFHFELAPWNRSVFDYDLVERRFHMKSYDADRIEKDLASADNALKELDKLRSITNEKKFSEAELKKYHEAYDLYKVKLLLSMWLLKGFPAGLPDNEDTPGVAEREEALQIAGKHEDSRCEDFWRARLFIARNLISHDSWHNHIFWNRRYHTTKDALNREIEYCEARLKLKAR